LREAKALGLNVSKVAENALKEAIRRLRGEGENCKNNPLSSESVCEVAPGGGFEPPRPLRVTDLAGLRPTRLGRFLPLLSLGDPG
jgi:hypothetical protein